MILSEIKAAVEAGQTVHWTNGLYRVIQDCLGQWMIVCDGSGQYCVGLTWSDGATLNGAPEDFFIAT